MPHQCRVAKIVISHLALPLRGSVGIALSWRNYTGSLDQNSRCSIHSL